jgi:hypothetical protein
MARFCTVLAGSLLWTLAGCSSSPATSSPTPGSASNKKPVQNGSSSSAARAETNAVAALPKSVFRADPQLGRDPFFPGSSRLVAKAEGTAPVLQLPVVSLLKLNGVRPGTSRPMAMINKTSLGVGEEGDVSVVVPNQLSRPEVRKVTIRCLEIRSDSVLINIAGENGVKELHLLQGK